MKFSVKFKEQQSKINVNFSDTQYASDGGFERGYEQGYQKGLSERKYETWTITLIDGTVVEKEVSLL